MELNKIYKDYEKYLKKGAKTVGCAAGALIAGFFVFFLKYRKQLTQGEKIEKKEDEKVIPIEKLEKIVNKIKHIIIHNMTLMYDLSHSYDPTEFDDKEEDIQIEELKVEDKPVLVEGATELLQDTLQAEEAKKEKKANAKQTENRVDAMKNNFRVYVNNPKIRDEKLLSYELQQIKKYELEPQEYYNALKKNLNNENIKKNVNIIAEFKRHLDKDELMKIDFPESLTKNYIKIITNIYYHNLRKTQKKFKDEFLNKGYDFRDASETANAFNDIYKSFLKVTRREVLEFFEVKEQELLSSKVMLRIYPLYFSPYHPLRKEYEKINQNVNALIKKIQQVGAVDELYNDSHPDAHLRPVDKVIDFEHMLKDQTASIISTNSIIINEQQQEKIEEKAEDLSRKERILNKFEEVYGDKRKESEEKDDE
jgi:hypothetical protein